MPALLFARLEGDTHRKLYNEQLVPFKSSIFDQYKVKDLAPYSKRHHIANFWWMRINPRHPHSVLAWHDEEGHEVSVLLPGEMRWQDTLTLARDLFKPVIPSAVSFRLNNYEEPYSYV